MTYTTEFSDEKIRMARQFGEEHAKPDARTHDKANVVQNKSVSRIAEMAFIRAATDASDSTVKWVADESEGQPPYDVEVGELKVDVKSSDNSDSRCNLMPGDYILRDSRDVDALALVRVEPDLSEAEVYGYVTIEDFNEECHFFPPVGELRMMNDELRPISDL